MLLIRLAPIFLAVAVFAFVVRSRHVFLLGTLLSFLGPLLARTNSTAGFIHDAVSNSIEWQIIGVFGAVLGCALGYLIVRNNNLKLQFSISFLILTMTIAALIVSFAL